MHLNVLLFYYFFSFFAFCACGYSFLYHQLGHRPDRTVWSLAKTCLSVLEGCLYVPSIFVPPVPLLFLQRLRSGGGKAPQLAQCRVRSWSSGRALDRCPGCSFLHFQGICASTVCCCCARGSVRSTFCPPSVRPGFFCAWAPPENKPRLFKLLPDVPRTTQQQQICRSWAISRALASTAPALLMERFAVSGELGSSSTDFINQTCKANNSSVSAPAWKGTSSKAGLPGKQLAASLFIHLNLAVKWRPCVLILLLSVVQNC